MALKIDLRPGETLQIGEATVAWEQKSGQLVRLVIDAPKTVPVKKLEATSTSMRMIAEHGLMLA